MRCVGCHWWFITDRMRVQECTECVSIHPSILVKYDLSPASTPLEILLEELPRTRRLLNVVEPRRLELLVKEILKGSHGCDVIHVGRTGDGGIDLGMLDSDQPIAVQIKRRANTGHFEGVAVIREFLGAMVSMGFRRGIFVTTADSYTSGARAFPKLVKRNASSIARLELWDCHRLLKMHKLIQPPPQWRPWRDLSYYDEKYRPPSGRRTLCPEWD